MLTVMNAIAEPMTAGVPVTTGVASYSIVALLVLLFGARRRAERQQPTSAAKKPRRIYHQVSGENFWAVKLAPLLKLDEKQAEAALSDLAENPILHPTYGSKRFPKGYLRSKYRELRSNGTMRSAAIAITPPPPEELLPPPAESGLFAMSEIIDENTVTLAAPTLKLAAEALIVSTRPRAFDRVTEYLSNRHKLNVEYAESATDALDRIYAQSFKLLLIQYPLADVNVRSLLEAIRQDHSHCLHSSILLLAVGRNRDEAESCIGRGANRILSPDASLDDIEREVTALLNIPDRKLARLATKIEPMDGDSDLLLCQTSNVSASGMLLNTDRRYDVGTRCRFEFQLPNVLQPIRGIATVIRHTTGNHERADGLGLRFVSFESETRGSFESHLARL